MTNFILNFKSLRSKLITRMDFDSEKLATEEQKKYSQLVRSEYIKSIYQPFDNEKNLTNFAETQESSIFAESLQQIQLKKKI